MLGKMLWIDCSGVREENGCKGIAQMPLTDTDVKALVPTSSRYRVSDGKSLFVEVNPQGGKYFVWVYQMGIS